MKNYKKVNYKGNIKLIPSHIIKEYWSGIPDQEGFKKYIKETTKKITKKEMVNRILNFIQNNNISEVDLKIFKKILGDHKILNKLQICIDGSHTNGRIFYKNFFNNNNNSISVDGEYWYEQYCKNHKSQDIIKKLNYMKNHFEIIYLHLVNDEQALEDKQWSKMMDEMCCDDYYEDYEDYENII